MLDWGPPPPPPTLRAPDDRCCRGAGVNVKGVCEGGVGPSEDHVTPPVTCPPLGPVTGGAPEWGRRGTL